jgi:hypothetical protein
MSLLRSHARAAAPKLTPRAAVCRIARSAGEPRSPRGADVRPCGWRHRLLGVSRVDTPSLSCRYYYPQRGVGARATLEAPPHAPSGSTTRPRPRVPPDFGLVAACRCCRRPFLVAHCDTDVSGNKALRINAHRVPVTGSRAVSTSFAPC